MKRQTHSNQAPRDSRPPPRWWDMRCAVFTPLFLALSIVLALAAPFAHAADKVAICYGAVSSALVPLAKQRDFYTAEGLDMDVHLFPSGRQALEAMLAGECDLSAAAETPVTHYSLARNDFRIIASISISKSFERVVVRTDRGIVTPADLRGRRIAVAQFTGAHYFLDTFLVANGLMPQDVSKVYLPAQEVVPAFLRGDVDAITHWEPNIHNAATALGTKAKVFVAPGVHVSPFLLVGRYEYVRKNPVSIERILRALLSAERFAREQPANAKALVARNYTASPDEIELIWLLFEFRVSLGQTLPFILENSARWEIGLMPPAQRPAMPNYLDFIYIDGLLAVKPAAVTLIH